MFQSNAYPATIIEQSTRPYKGTSLLYILGIVESVVRRLLPYNAKITHTPHTALRPPTSFIAAQR